MHHSGVQLMPNSDESRRDAPILDSLWSYVSVFGVRASVLLLHFLQDPFSAGYNTGSPDQTVISFARVLYTHSAVVMMSVLCVSLLDSSAGDYLN